MIDRGVHVANIVSQRFVHRDMLRSHREQFGLSNSKFSSHMRMDNKRVRRWGNKVIAISAGVIRITPAKLPHYFYCYFFLVHDFLMILSAVNRRYFGLLTIQKSPLCHVK
jgi:hypothetical protein